ncbi:unnamed protein product [Rotaria sordida]|uniref:Uncharacterized protein n=1 Tax=Rotaria sordida TaxID=392033 RepID=A0A818UZ95_9BILA|nr:unnamed protein product [Rotaria sordida]CAF3698875.1 unnamed protein product [Rotaria sordida]
MNKMDDKQRYRSYYGNKNYHDRQYDDDNNNRQYKHHYQYSSSYCDDRLHNNNNNNNQINFSNQQYQYQQSNSNMYSYFSDSSPLPLMNTKTINSSTLLTAIPHERESWIRSVKKTKTNESTEQKTQYLETMLRMPQQQQQQKSSINSSTFDRIRFANDQISTTMNATDNNNNFNGSSFHFITDTNNYNDVSAIERILFNNSLPTTNDKCSNLQLLPTPPPSIVDCEPTLRTNSNILPHSGFLIDNCDEVEELSSPLSPPSRLPLMISSTIKKSTQQNQKDLNEQCVMLVNELNVADVEQKKVLKHRKRLQKKFPKKKKQSNNKIEDKQIIESESISNIYNTNHEELPSDWIFEADTIETNRISQITNMIRRVSTNMTDEDKITKVNIILKKIKRQQKELRKLRKYVISMLDEEQKQNSTNTIRQNVNINQDLLISFLNQPTLSGCWLCSGKKYTEVATQYNNIDLL